MKMFRLSVLTTAFVAAVCLARTADAQPGGGFRGGFGGGGLTQILGIEGVGKELDLTDEQQEEVKGLIAEIRELSQKEIQESIGEIDFRNASDEERAEIRKKMEKVTAKISKKEKQELGDILLKHQLERLEELRIQRAGIGALADPAVIEKLDISKDQQAKIQTAQDGIQAKMREAFSGGGGFDREKFQKLREDSDKEILAVLDSSQKKKFEEMKGKAFEFPQRQPGGRQGGNRPQGGARPESN